MLRKARQPGYLKGVIDIYVDDWMGLSRWDWAQQDQKAIHNLVKDTFNYEGAVKIKKSVPPTTRIEILGGLIDLTEEYIRPNDKGCDKILYTFFAIDEREKQSRNTFEILGGVASRYANFLPFMQPFVGIFFVQMGNFKKEGAKLHKLSSSAKMCIEIWRIVAVMLWVNKEALRLPLQTMRLNNKATQTSY